MLVLVSETLLTQFYCMMKVRILFTTSQADYDPAQLGRLHSLSVTWQNSKLSFSLSVSRNGLSEPVTLSGIKTLSWSL